MKKRILIVDNDEALLEAYKALLSEGYDVAIAMDGKEGLEIFKEFRPHLVLVDILMPRVEGIEADLPVPVMDGAEFTRGVKKIAPDAKIVAISAFARSRGKEILDAGALEVVKKPLKREKLIEIIEKHIG